MPASPQRSVPKTPRCFFVRGVPHFSSSSVAANSTAVDALNVVATTAEAIVLRRDFEQQRAQGLTVEWLDSAAEIAALEPALYGGNALCATHTPLSGSVQPGLATHRFAAEAAVGGCAIVASADVVSLRRFWSSKHNARRAWKATTADGATGVSMRHGTSYLPRAWRQLLSPTRLGCAYPWCRSRVWSATALPTPSPARSRR